MIATTTEACISKSMKGLSLKYELCKQPEACCKTKQNCPEQIKQNATAPTFKAMQTTPLPTAAIYELCINCSEFSTLFHILKTPKQNNKVINSQGLNMLQSANILHNETELHDIGIVACYAQNKKKFRK